jgi:hypothetical protein
MRRLHVGLVVSAAALIAAAGLLLVTGYVHFGKPARVVPVAGSAARSPRPASDSASPAAAAAAAALETDPAAAKRYAEAAVGDCLEGAWGNAGYVNLFDTYQGHGVVEFSTGTANAPTGDYADDTLIDVHVYTNGTVAGMPGGSAGGPPPAALDNAALSYWGCLPNAGKADGGSGPPSPAVTPAGLEHDGALDISCHLTGTAGYTSYQAVITLYNPGTQPVEVSQLGAEWGSNGVLMSQASSATDLVLRPGQLTTQYLGPAPPAATSCVAGWH